MKCNRTDPKKHQETEKGTPWTQAPSPPETCIRWRSKFEDIPLPMSSNINQKVCQNITADLPGASEGPRKMTNHTHKRRMPRPRAAKEQSRHFKRSAWGTPWVLKGAACCKSLPKRRSTRCQNLGRSEKTTSIFNDGYTLS